MRRYGKRFISILLTSVMLMTSVLPTAAAPAVKESAKPFSTRVSSAAFDVSGLSDETWAFVADYTKRNSEKGSLGVKVNGYNTEEVKKAVWDAIFMNRDSQWINFGALGISEKDANALVSEVLAEAGAQDAVSYSVNTNEEGETVVKKQIDPVYALAYEEIEAATANTVSNEPQTASVSEDGIAVLAESEEEVEAAEESPYKDAIAAFNQYQQFIDDNPDYFGITVPYNSVKDDEKLGGGPITSLITIANQKVDYNGDGVVDDNDNGVTLLDLFQAGYMPVEDVMKIIQLFDMSNQLGVNLLGRELLAAKDKALNVVPNDVSDEQRLLILNDWLADFANFDMPYIMDILEAPEPKPLPVYETAKGAIKNQNPDMPDEQVEELVAALIGSWKGNHFGVLCESMDNTGVCLSYTMAYAYLIQWEFSEVYKSNGKWRDKVEMNFIEESGAQVSEVALVALDAEELGETPEEPGETPEEPGETPEEPGETPEEPGETPEEPGETPEEPGETPEEPGETPEEPGETPEEPGETPEEPGETPEEHKHNYEIKEESWDWSEYSSAKVVKVTFECKNEGCDENSKVVSTDKISSEVTKQPTCTEAGETTYTATVEFEEKNYSNEKTENKPEATGHKFAEEPSSIRWESDNSAAYAVFECTVENCDGTEEKKADVTTDKVGATCTTDGKTVYTATYEYTLNGESKKITDTQEEVIKATGHKFDSDGVCTVCEAYKYKWSPDVPAMVDYVRITFDTEISMFGQPDQFENDHYWNAVKVNGQWYYVDPCYNDIYVECMSRDRVETDGNMSHLYFLFSDESCRQLYSGYYKSIDTLYNSEESDISNDKTYEKAWFAFARSPIYRNNNDYYYFYDSTDMIAMNNNSMESMDEDSEFKLVYRDGTKKDSEAVKGEDGCFTVLIDFNEGKVRSNNKMVNNQMIADLYEEHKDYQSKYPSIATSCDMEGDKLYFNLSNCVLSYDIKTGDVVKVFEYNEVSAERDLSEGLGGMGFYVVHDEDAESSERTTGELTTLTVKDNPIASMTIKNGNMYISVGTTIGYISGKDPEDPDDDGIGYQFEETNYNPDYQTYKMSNGQYGDDDGKNDNDEFMWSANFVDVVEISHLTGDKHTYDTVYVEASCGKNAYTEDRCTECGLIKADSRVEVLDTALEHHFVKSDERYYTKTNDQWNTGTCYVCTICKDAKDTTESGDHVGHVKTGIVTEWAEDLKSAVMAVGCKPCYGVNYDCLIGDENIVVTEGLDATVSASSKIVYDKATGKDKAILVYTATAKYENIDYTDALKLASKSPFPDVTELDYFFDPVLWAVENKVTDGYPNGYFGPADGCTRGQAVTFLSRAYKGSAPENAENPFPDVKEGEYYYDAVLWAVDKGITEGYPNGNFGTNDTCTRAQIVTFLYRAAGEPKVTTTKNPFPDVKEGEFYYNAVLWAVENDITTGYPDGTFGVNDECTRGQIVTFLYRALAK